MGSATASVDIDEQVEIRTKFNSIWPEFLEEIKNEFKAIPKVANWLEEVMEQNVTRGKQTRAIASLTLYHQLVPENERDPKLCYILGWCAEISHAACLMADDIMDESETRRGVKCWYKFPNVGFSAINDSFILENLTYSILYKYFCNEPYFHQLLAHTHDINMKTIVGQSLDTRCSVDFDFAICTLETYKQIVDYKTSYYSFYSPVASALIMAQMADDAMLESVKEITLLMGYLFQVQDDYLDCYGDPDVTGKIGTDIKDSKCTWLLVKALELCDENQKNIIKNSYGRKSEDDENAVKQVYKDLELEQVFRSFEKEIYSEIAGLVNSLPECLPRGPFLAGINAIYCRDS